jgi:hypothetical protein
MLSSQKLGLGIEISDSWCFGVKCIKIRMTDSSSGRSNIKRGVYKGFDGFIDQEMATVIKECHERIVQYLNPVHVEIGYLGVHTRDFDLLYFKEAPDMSRFGDVEIYGSNVAIHLDKLNHWLSFETKHNNGFDVFSESWGIEAVPYLKGYSDPGWFYFNMYRDRDIDNFNLWISPSIFMMVIIIILMMVKKYP